MPLSHPLDPCASEAGPRGPRRVDPAGRGVDQAVGARVGRSKAAGCLRCPGGHLSPLDHSRGRLEVGLDPEQLLREFSAAHPDDLPAPVGPGAVVEVPQGTPGAAGRARIHRRDRPARRRRGLLWLAVAARKPMRRRSPTPARPAPPMCGGRRSCRPAASPKRRAATARPVVVTLTISSKCQLRIVADGREVLGRTLSRASRCRSSSATRWCCSATTRRRAVQHQRPGRAPARRARRGAVGAHRPRRLRDFLARY